MLFSLVFIATNPRLFTLFTLFTLLALSFEGSLEGLASFPSVVAVCPASPYSFPASLSHSRRSLSHLELYTYKSLSKQRPLTICRMIDIQKTWGEGWLLLTRFPKRTGLNAGNEVAVEGHIAVGHPRRIEGKAGVAVAIEQDEAAGGVRALAKEVYSFARGKIRGRELA